MENTAKKLLLLGGSRYLLPVIEAAHSLGLYVISCDYLPDNIAHRYSDEYRNVSIIDKEAVLSLAREEKIDGIMSFACDPGVVTAAYVAEKLHLPFAGSYESVSILQNKGRFRAFLKENGFNVPWARSYSSAETALGDASDFPWPVIVKPVDSAGSKGVTRLDSPDALESAVLHAADCSLCGDFIIEEFITPLGHSTDSDSFSLDGRLSYASFDDQLFDGSAENPYTPAAYSWPSTMPESAQRELRGELQRLISLLGLGTSVYNIETRLGTNGKTYIMELSPRGGGNRLSEVLHMASGVDLIQNAVRAAMGMPVDMMHDPVYKGCWAEVILHSGDDGVFNELWIDESMRPYVVQRDLWVKPGDAVERFTGANKAIGTLVMNFPSERELADRMSDMHWHKVLVSK